MITIAIINEKVFVESNGFVWSEYVWNLSYMAKEDLKEIGFEREIEFNRLRFVDDIKESTREKISNLWWELSVCE
jgi:hypothetical protein